MASAKNGEQIRLERRTSLHRRVTFDHPPLNIFGPETIPQLNEIVTALEADSNVKVVFFDRAVDGYVNRARPDAELDAFVEALAMRIASFDKQAIVETKIFVNIASLPPDAEIARE